MEEMRDIINVSDRRLVVITDPHIKANDNYRVYKNGERKEKLSDEDGKFRTNIFVKSSYMYTY